MEDSQVVAALSKQLAQRIGMKRYAVWFGPQTRLCVGAECLTIRSANTFVRDWLRKNYADDIRACWENVAGRPLPVEFDVDGTLASLAPSRDEAPKCAEEFHCGTPSATADTSDLKTVEDSSRRGIAGLETFVVGPSNERAFKAAELTGRGRHQASPILFCGPTGVGKTHLLRGVVREFRRHHPRAAAVYIAAEQFTTGFVEAIRGGGLPSFRQKCRGARLLVIDDVQFFAGKQRTIEELQHTVDALLADGRQIVLGSDRSLAELRALGPELTSRLAGGLVCEIEPPEFATRVAILRRLGGEMQLALEDDVLRAVATQITVGARELRGALHRLAAESHAAGQPITRELAARALADMARHCTRTVRLADVEDAVCDVFGIEPAQLRSARKARTVSEPRILAMWLARKYTRSAWSEIGEFFGRRSHSTVISAHRRVERLISSQAQIEVNDRPCGVEEAIRRLEQKLRTA
ncbi:MAG TPA: chromosomal replication initiator protein DnaA [Lacipirellulaceae bacterium]|nr:chromosomal replication initiator protein DnaA [Lacipirellulaceae bacterium]